jgi:hypothetical protein
VARARRRRHDTAATQKRDGGGSAARVFDDLKAANTGGVASADR